MGVGFGAACGNDAPPKQIEEGGRGGAGGAGGGGGDAPTTEGVISENPGSSYETDPRLSVNGEVVAVAWTGRAAPSAPATVGYAISTNGGATFEEAQNIVSSELDSFQAPDISVDNGGNAYVVFLGHPRSAGGATVYFASSNGGTTFSEPVAITDTETVSYFGRPSLTLTNTNRIVVAYTETVGTTAELRVATREQTGSEWTIQQLSQGGPNHAFPTPCAAAETLMGRTYLVELVQGRISLLRSDDNGDTWNGIQASQDGDQVRGRPSCVAQGDHVWVSYGTSGDTGLEEIKVAYSPDGGETIMDVGVVSDPEIRPVFALHQLAVEPPETGHLIYYNGAGLADQGATLRRVRFSPTNLMQEPPILPDDPPPGLPSVLVHEPVTLQLVEDDVRWLGDGVGLDYDGSDLYIAYVDNSSAMAHISFTVVSP